MNTPAVLVTGASRGLSRGYVVAVMAVMAVMAVAAVAAFATSTLASEPKAAPKLRTFDKQTLSERFVAEGCALADFDHDGHVDLTAGWSIWYGPEFTRRADFTPPANNPGGITKTPYDPASG